MCAEVRTSVLARGRVGERAEERRLPFNVILEEELGEEKERLLADKWVGVAHAQGHRRYVTVDEGGCHKESRPRPSADRSHHPTLGCRLTAVSARVA